MKLTNYNKTLIKYSEPFWSKMVSHKFCEEMGDGTIDKKLLNKYLLIEYSFVKDAINLFGYGFIHATSIDSKISIFNSIKGLLFEQDKFFLEALNNPFEKTPYSHKVLDFKTFMTENSKKSYLNFLTVFLAAESLYYTWCKNQLYKNKLSQHSTIHKWLNLHIEENFTNQIIFFSDELENKFSKDINYINKLFLETIKYELGFHDAVYD